MFTAKYQKKITYYTLSVASVLALSVPTNSALAANLRLDKKAAYLSVEANRSEQKLSQLAQKARQAGDFSQALSYYKALADRHPSYIDYQVAHALVQIDSQNYDMAEAEISAIKDKHADHVEVLNAQIYLGQQTNSAIKILDAGQRLLAINPNNKAILTTIASAASNLGATGKALALSEQYQLSNQTKQDITAQHAALYIRRGELDATNPREPYAETDKALRLLDSACNCDWAEIDVSQANNQRLVFDRMQALLNRHRAAEVVMHFDQLKAKQVNMPAHALRSAGGAFLYLREPKKALDLFNEVLTKNANNHDVQLDKFYALIELERFDEATQLINQVSASQTSYHNRNDNPIVRHNDKKLQADLTKALSLSYGDDLAASEALLTGLHKVGPSNAEVQNALYDVWRQRGWLDKAQKAYATNLARDKENTRIQYGLADTYLDGRDWTLANLERSKLNAYLSPDATRLKALNRRWQLHQKRQLTSSFLRRDSSGAAISAVSRNINTSVYSAPYDNYRAYLNGGYSHDEFPEGTGIIIRPSAGVEYRSHHWFTTAQLGAATRDGNDASGAVNATYRANDYWSFNTSAAFNSIQSPVRGQRVGINGDSVSAGATYRWNDLMQASASINFMKMEDGNKRQGLQMSLDRRVLTKPHYKANLTLLAAVTRNSLGNNVAYYNPKSDAQVEAILYQDWLTWRRYETSFTQRLGLGYGHYQQKNFGGDATWLISYSHQWNLNNIFGLEYGVSRRNQAYDGQSEFNDSIFGGINLLF